MRKAIIATTFAVLLIPAAAHASPSVTFTAPTQQTVGVASVFDSTGTVCDVPPCSYAWRWYRPTTSSDYDRLGTTMGFGPVLSYTFSTAGTKIVRLKVTNSTSTHGYGIFAKSVAVSP